MEMFDVFNRTIEEPVTGIEVALNRTAALHCGTHTKLRTLQTREI
jgi:hypothetical protein